MPDIEKKFGRIITIERETQKERADALREADECRLEAAGHVKRVPSIKFRNNHDYWYQKELDLQNFPLTVRVRFLGIPIPAIGTFLQTEYFEDTITQP